jgi:hypothetical protein
MSKHWLIRFKMFVSQSTTNCAISFWFHLHLVLHACADILMWWRILFLHSGIWGNIWDLNRPLITKATFRCWKNFKPMNSTTFVLFGKYCPIMDQLGSKNLSRDFQLNCVISYFLPTFTTSCMGPKIDVMEREWKNFNFWSASKQGLKKSCPWHKILQHCSTF